MKNLIYKTIFLFGFLFVLGACEEDVMVELNPDANTVVSLSPSTVVLLEDNAAANATTVSWTEPDFGFDAAATYTIMIDFHGGTFATPQTVTVGNNLSKVFTVAELNSKLLALGVSADEATQIDIKVETKLSNYKKMYSAPITMNVTAYSTLLDLSTNWGVVGSATPGSWGSTPTTPIQDIPFWTTSTAGVYVAYGTVRTGEIKFRLDNAWTTNYGGPGMSGTLVAGGSNIAITAGTYKFTVNTNNMTYTVVPYTWGIVGSGALNGWGAPDAKLYYNSYADDWRAVVTLLDGEIKFRFNEDWAVNYGDNGNNGSLEASGDNIPVSAGHYLVIFNPVTLEYSLEEMDVWGLVGDGTPTGWGTLPDIKFIPDFGINEGVYYINGVTLTAGGFIKVRQNDAWGLNYGDTGNNGSLEANGDNIPVPATGMYNVKINMNDPKTINLYPFQ
jgi:starch-binding outer membrane protein SusE/F